MIPGKQCWKSSESAASVALTQKRLLQREDSMCQTEDRGGDFASSGCNQPFLKMVSLTSCFYCIYTCIEVDQLFLKKRLHSPNNSFYRIRVKSRFCTVMQSTISKNGFKLNFFCLKKKVYFVLYSRLIKFKSGCIQPFLKVSTHITLSTVLLGLTCVQVCESATHPVLVQIHSRKSDYFVFH